MDRRVLLSVLCASLVTASAGLAASYEEAVVAQLRAQGYTRITLERTLLGRVRILSHMGSGKREIILNPRTGEVLRDILLDAEGNIAPQIAGASDSGDSDSGGGSGSGSEDDSGGEDNGGGEDSGDGEDSGSGSGAGEEPDDHEADSDSSGSDESGGDDPSDTD